MKQKLWSVDITVNKSTKRQFYWLRLFLAGTVLMFSFSCLRKILQDIMEHPRGAQQFSFPLKEPKKNTKQKSLKQNAEGSQLSFANGSRYLKYYQDLFSLAYSSAFLWLALIIDSVLGKELLLHLFLLH